MKTFLDFFNFILTIASSYCFFTTTHVDCWVQSYKNAACRQHPHMTPMYFWGDIPAAPQILHRKTPASQTGDPKEISLCLNLRRISRWISIWLDPTRVSFYQRKQVTGDWGVDQLIKTMFSHTFDTLPFPRYGDTKQFPEIFGPPGVSHPTLLYVECTSSKFAAQ